MRRRVRGGTVLVAEDDAIRLMVTATLADDLGVNAVGVPDAARALERIAEEPPALVVIDRRMPVLDGHELVLRLRCAAATRAIPIVAMSTHEGGEQACAGGWDALLSKPLDLDELVALVRRLFEAIP